MNQIFISYSSSDRAWAEELEQRLKTGGLDVYRDKSRLSIATPFQKQLFNEIDNSEALIILWSGNVRDMHGQWKEWIITEREHFRGSHPTKPIIYLLLDETAPDVDGELHKLDDIRDSERPSKVTESKWADVLRKVKAVTCTNKIEIECYILAASRSEFDQLANNPNLASVLNDLKLKFEQVANWYGPNREDWKPAGSHKIKDLLTGLEPALTAVLAEDGVPDSYKGNIIITRTGLTGLWNPIDSEVTNEINRMARLNFCWIIVDPFSLYHLEVQKVAQRIAACAEHNRWLNLYLLDVIGFIHDRSKLRNKLQNDFAALYQRLMRPRLHDNQAYLGGIDVWHYHDFERVFRETVRLQRQIRGIIDGPTSLERNLAIMSP